MMLFLCLHIHVLFLIFINVSLNFWHLSSHLFLWSLGFTRLFTQLLHTSISILVITYFVHPYGSHPLSIPLSLFTPRMPYKQHSPSPSLSGIVGGLVLLSFTLYTCSSRQAVGNSEDCLLSYSRAPLISLLFSLYSFHFFLSAFTSSFATSHLFVQFHPWLSPFVP